MFNMPRLYMVNKTSLKRSFKSSFSLWTKMLEKNQSALSLNLNFLCLAVCKTLQLKVNNFPLSSVLPFREFCDRSFNVQKLRLNLIEQMLICNSEPLLLVDNNAAENTF